MTTTRPEQAPVRHDVRLLAAALCAWAFTAAALALDLPTPWLGVTCVGGLSVSVIALLRHRHILALAAAATCLVLASAAHESARSEAGNLAELAEDGATARLTVVTTSGARKVPAGRFESAPRYAISATVLHAQARGRSVQLHTPITLIGPQEYARVPWRSTLDVSVRLAPPQRLGQARALAVASEKPHSVSTRGPLHQVEQIRQRFTTATSRLPDDPAGLVPALVVGDTSALPETLNADMNATGMSHLNAVSGSNITIVLVAVIWCLSRTGLPYRARTALALASLVGYVALCHPDPSVIRAAAMGAVGVLGTSVGRRAAACPALGAAIVLLLVLTPWLAVSAGFALSALATLGLILFARPWAGALTKLTHGRFARCWELLTIPLAAQALCLPILVVLSGGVSLISVPANVLAEPFVAPATLAGMVVLAIAQVSVPAASLAAWVPGLPAWAISCVAHVSADVPGGIAPWPGGWPGAALALVLVTGALCGWRAVRFAGWWGACALALMALPLVALRAPVPGEDARHEHWQFVVCDVGQGDAILVRTGPSSAILVDTGDEQARPDECVERYGVSRLDAVVLSHFHADHVAALARVTKLTQAVYVTPVEQDASDSSQRGEKGMKPHVDRVLERAGLQSQPWPADASLTFADVTVTSLWPRRVIRSGSVQNNASLVLHVASPRLNALLLGDAEKESEQAVAAHVSQIAAGRSFDVIKVAHHGSNNQSPRLYQAARARFAAISVGEGNDYGHPGKRLLAMLAAAQSTPVRTDQCGDVVFVADRGGVRPASQRCSG